MLVLGLVFVVVAIVLVLAEAHLTTGGLIASVSVAALVSGVALLLLAAGAGLLAVLAVAGGVLAASSAGLLLVGRSLLSVRSLRPRSGTEAMVGRLGVVRAGDAGIRVFIDGGLWRARPSLLQAGSALHDGDQVVVERVNGLTLDVREAEEWELMR
ncbi:MAG: NfeD family protein [Solirubrobacteraceae bacterium]